MIEVLWEFEAREEKKEEFEREYCAKGGWAKFFRRSPAYHGTKLLVDSENRYITCDSWDSQEAYEEFRLANRQEYEELDDRYKALTVSERCLGIFEVK